MLRIQEYHGATALQTPIVHKVDVQLDNWCRPGSRGSAASDVDNAGNFWTEIYGGVP